MKVRVAARAPTTPPDMGASTKRPDVVQWMAFAMEREVVGSMVEQSMKSRVGVEGGRGVERRVWKREVMCVGEGRTVMIVCFWGEGGVSGWSWRGRTGGGG